MENFHKMLLTSKSLDFLGFTEYWGDSGDSGTRTLDLGGTPGDKELLFKKEYPSYHIHIIDEKEDECDGYCQTKVYCSEHIVTKDWEPLYFLHEMYEDILMRRTQKEIANFLKLLEKCNMTSFITSYLNYKNGSK